MKLTGENPKYAGEKPVPEPLSPPQIPRGLNRESNPGLRGDRPATNRLSHGAPRTAFSQETDASCIKRNVNSLKYLAN
jgi:hypothetical protein